MACEGQTVDPEEKTNLILENRKNSNYLVDLLELLESEEQDDICKAISCLGIVFKEFLKRRIWHEQLESSTGLSQESENFEDSGTTGDVSKQDAERVFANWLHDKYLLFVKTLIGLLTHSSKDVQKKSLHRLMQLLLSDYQAITSSPNYDETKPYFPNTLFARIVSGFVAKDVPNKNSFLKTFNEYLSYTDIQFYTLKNLNKILGGAKFEKKESRKHFACELLLKITSGKDSEDSEKLFIKNHPDKEKFSWESKEKLKAFTDTWLSLLRSQLPHESLKKVLLKLHEDVIPYMQDPKLLIDFLTDAYDIEGPISLLALNGLFILIQQHNLDYPDFFKKLYHLINPETFELAYRERFFVLTDLFLTSTNLPAYVVAAFVKRFARLSLTASPDSIKIILALIENLMKRHPSCKLLIHRKQKSTEDSATDEQPDPYKHDEVDPAKCNAINSSLWELKTLEQHYHPDIQEAVKVFQRPFNKDERDIAELLQQNYGSIFAEDFHNFDKEDEIPLAFKAQSLLFNQTAFDQPLIGEEERIRHDALFYSQYPDDGLLLSGERARSLFIKSKLPLPDLSKIWKLSDVTRDNMLDEGEFVIAMHLIQKRLCGNEIPESIPPHVRPTSRPLLVIAQANQNEIEAYSAVFDWLRQHDEDILSSEDVLSFLNKSKLPPDVLAKIWDLSDIDRDGRINKDELYIAIHLTRFCKNSNSDLDGSIDVLSILPKQSVEESIQEKRRRRTEYQTEIRKLTSLRYKLKSELINAKTSDNAAAKKKIQCELDDVTHQLEAMEEKETIVRDEIYKMNTSTSITTNIEVLRPFDRSFLMKRQLSGVDFLKQMKQGLQSKFDHIKEEIFTKDNILEFAESLSKDVIAENLCDTKKDIKDKRIINNEHSTKDECEADHSRDDECEAGDIEESGRTRNENRRQSDKVAKQRLSSEESCEGSEISNPNQINFKIENITDMEGNVVKGPDNIDKKDKKMEESPRKRSTNALEIFQKLFASVDVDDAATDKETKTKTSVKGRIKLEKSPWDKEKNIVEAEQAGEGNGCSKASQDASEETPSIKKDGDTSADRTTGSFLKLKTEKKELSEDEILSEYDVIDDDLLSKKITVAHEVICKNDIEVKQPLSEKENNKDDSSFKKEEEPLKMEEKLSKKEEETSEREIIADDLFSKKEEDEVDKPCCQLNEIQSSPVDFLDMLEETLVDSDEDADTNENKIVEDEGIKECLIANEERGRKFDFLDMLEESNLDSKEEVACRKLSIKEEAKEDSMKMEEDGNIVSIGVLKAEEITVVEGDLNGDDDIDEVKGGDIHGDRKGILSSATRKVLEEEEVTSMRFEGERFSDDNVVEGMRTSDEKKQVSDKRDEENIESDDEQNGNIEEEALEATQKKTRKVLKTKSGHTVKSRSFHGLKSRTEPNRLSYVEECEWLDGLVKIELEGLDEKKKLKSQVSLSDSPWKVVDPFHETKVKSREGPREFDRSETIDESQLDLASSRALVKDLLDMEVACKNEDVDNIEPEEYLERRKSELVGGDVTCAAEIGNGLECQDVKIKPSSNDRSVSRRDDVLNDTRDAESIARVGSIKKNGDFAKGSLILQQQRKEKNIGKEKKVLEVDEEEIKSAEVGKVQSFEQKDEDSSDASSLKNVKAFKEMFEPATTSRPVDSYKRPVDVKQRSVQLGNGKSVDDSLLGEDPTAGHVKVKEKQQSVNMGVRSALRKEEANRVEGVKESEKIKVIKDRESEKIKVIKDRESENDKVPSSPAKTTSVKAATREEIKDFKNNAEIEKNLARKPRKCVQEFVENGESGVPKEKKTVQSSTASEKDDEGNDNRTDEIGVLKSVGEFKQLFESKPVDQEFKRRPLAKSKSEADSVMIKSDVEAGRKISQARSNSLKQKSKAEKDIGSKDERDGGLKREEVSVEENSNKEKKKFSKNESHELNHKEDSLLKKEDIASLKKEDIVAEVYDVTSNVDENHNNDEDGQIPSIKDRLALFQTGDIGSNKEVEKRGPKIRRSRPKSYHGGSSSFEDGSRVEIDVNVPDNELKYEKGDAEKNGVTVGDDVDVGFVRSRKGKRSVDDSGVNELGGWMLGNVKGDTDKGSRNGLLEEKEERKATEFRAAAGKTESKVQYSTGDGKSKYMPGKGSIGVTSPTNHQKISSEDRLQYEIKGKEKREFERRENELTKRGTNQNKSNDISTEINGIKDHKPSANKQGTPEKVANQKQVDLVGKLQDKSIVKLENDDTYSKGNGIAVNLKKKMPSRIEQELEEERKREQELAVERQKRIEEQKELIEKEKKRLELIEAEKRRIAEEEEAKKQALEEEKMKRQIRTRGLRAMFETA
eukprot:gene8231-9113_t